MQTPAYPSPPVFSLYTPNSQDAVFRLTVSQKSLHHMAPLPLLLPYQKKWINDPSPIKLMEKSRQIGISWATAYSVIRRHLSAENTLDTFISTRDHYLSRLFLKDCQSFADLLHTFLKQKGRPILCKKQLSKSTLNFSNGTRIQDPCTALPCLGIGARRQGVDACAVTKV